MPRLGRTYKKRGKNAESFRRRRLFRKARSGYGAPPKHVRE